MDADKKDQELNRQDAKDAKEWSFFAMSGEGGIKLTL
jgi:hypothetical protein